MTTTDIFETIFQRNLYRSAKKQISKETLQVAKDFALLVAIEKAKEKTHQIDGSHSHKRFTTGVSGELAVEALLGKKFVDLSVGASKNYNHADLLPIGYNVGVKTVERGKFPLIDKESKRPEIIVVKDENEFYIMGLALPGTLCRYHDLKYVLTNCDDLKRRKSAFYGFDRLLPFHSFEEFECIMRDVR